MNFLDIDHEIEKQTNLKIKDFFKIYGEIIQNLGELKKVLY